MPVLGFLKARNGLRLRGYCGTSLEGASMVVVVAVALGSMEDVFCAICTGSAGDCCVAPLMSEGGKRVKNRRSRGWRSCARRTCLSIAAMVEDVR